MALNHRILLKNNQPHCNKKQRLCNEQKPSTGPLSEAWKEEVFTITRPTLILSEQILWRRRKKMSGKLIITVALPCAKAVAGQWLADFSRLTVKQASYYLKLWARCGMLSSAVATQNCHVTVICIWFTLSSLSLRSSAPGFWIPQSVI